MMAEVLFGDPPRPITVTRAEIVAAKLKVDLDKRLGKETPEIFKEVAKLSRD